MKEKVTISTVLLVALFLTVAPTDFASTTWYVDGVHGNDSNTCKSPTTACKTIGHGISLAISGDSIRVAAAICKENLSINTSLNVIGSGASTTIIDGGGVSRVVTTTAPSVVLSGLTIRNGLSKGGGGVYNSGILRINDSVVVGNKATQPTGRCPPSCHFGVGGGIANSGTLTINNTTISMNSATGDSGFGGSIFNSGTLTINNSTLNRNGAHGILFLRGSGGGIYNGGSVAINNSTLSENTSVFGGGNYGGPTLTIQLLSGSPAIDAGNPSGCRDSKGKTTDQRGLRRPDRDDQTGCDIGAYETQSY